MKEARSRNLFFSTDTHKHVAEGDIIFVRFTADPAVPTMHSPGYNPSVLDRSFWTGSQPSENAGA